MNYGLALATLGDHETTTRFARRAIEAYSPLLANNIRKDHVADWSRAHHNVALCKIQIGEKLSRQDALFDALDHLTLALSKRSPETAPLLFARTRSSMGRCYGVLYDMFGRHEFLDDFISAYRDAVDHWYPETDAKDWWHDNHRLVTALMLKLAKEEISDDEGMRIVREAFRRSKNVKDFCESHPDYGLVLSITELNVLSIDMKEMELNFGHLSKINTDV